MDEEGKIYVKEPNKEITKHEPALEAFGAIEIEFKTVMDGLGNDTKLVPFKVEYEKLFRALTKSFQHEQHLTKKCNELSSEINKNAAAVKEALQLSQKDQCAIALLKQDTEKAWASVEERKRKEQSIAHTVDRLQEEVNKLSEQLQQERARVLRQGEDLEKTSGEKDQLKALRDNHLHQIEQLSKTKSDFQKENESLESELEELTSKSAIKKKEMELQSTEINSVKKRYDASESSKVALKEKLEQKTIDYVDVQYSASLEKKKSDQLKKELREANTRMEKQASECEELSHQTQHLSDTVESQKNKMVSICDDLKKHREELKIAQAAQNRIASEKSHLQRKYDSEHRNALRLQQAVDDAKAIAHTREKEVHSLRQELDKSNRREDQSFRELEVINREKNLLTDKSQRYEQKAKEADEEIRHREQTIISLEKELSCTRDTAISTQKKLSSLEKLCEKHSNDLSHERTVAENVNDAVRSRDIELQDMKKEISKWELKSSDQMQMCNQLRAERGKTSRQLVDAQEDIKRLQNQVSILSNEIKSLRRELSSKDEFLAKERLDTKQEKAKKDQASGEVSRTKQRLDQQEFVIQKQDLEIRRLNATMKQMDDEVLDQKKEYDQIVNERDVLGAQLIRRNDEIALLQERMKMQEATLKKGEIQYKERLGDIRLLSIKLQDLKREINAKQETPSRDDHISRDLAKKEKELLEEKIKVKALSDELENPLNVHRWRKLGGSDPATFDLVQKIEILQKRLIKKTEQVMEKDAIIQEHDTSLASLKKQLDRHRQPDTTVVEKLSISENEVREKERQMRAMAGELNMNQTQVSEYRKEMDRLNHELHEMKHKYFEQKKKEAAMKERELEWLAESGMLDLDMDMERAEMDGMTLSSSHRLAQKPLRYVGGGFRAIPHVNHSSHCTDVRVVR